RRVYAARAYWEPQQRAWILESGWIRGFQSAAITRYAEFQVLEPREIDEPPAYFSREVRQSSEMDWWELRNYIGRLRHSGFDVARFSAAADTKPPLPAVAP